MISSGLSSTRSGHMPSGPHFVYLGTGPKGHGGFKIAFIAFACFGARTEALGACTEFGFTAHSATPPPEWSPVCLFLIAFATASSMSSPSHVPAPDCSPGSKPILILLVGTFPYVAKLLK